MSYHADTSTNKIVNTDFHLLKDWPEVINNYDPVVLLDLAGTVNGSSVEYHFSTDDYVTTSGVVYKAAILNDVALKEELADIVYGINTTDSITVELSNVDDGINDTWDTIIANMIGLEDIRGWIATIWIKTTIDGIQFKAKGKVTDYELSNILSITIDPREDALFDTLLPLRTVDTDIFDTSAMGVGAPINICFGNCRNVPCPNINNDRTNDYYDYLVGYGILQGLHVDHDNGYGVRRNGVLVNTAEYTFYDGSQGSPYSGYAFIRFVKEQLDFNNSYMAISADVYGLKMGGATMQRNGAEVLRNLLSDTTWGLSDSINTTSFTGAIADLNPTTGKIKNIYIDGAITERTEARDYINEILEICQSSLDRNKDGEWEITVDYEGRDSVMTLNENNFIIDKITTTSMDDSLKSGEIQYLWSAVNYDAPAQKITLDIHTNFGKDGVFEYRFVAEDNTAKKILSYKYGREMYSEGSRYGLVTGTAGLEARLVKVNDIVTLTDSARGLSAQKYIVKEKSYSGTEGINFTLRKYASEIYDDQTISAPTAIESQQTSGYNIGDGTVHGEVIIAANGAFKTSESALEGDAGVVIDASGIYAGSAAQAKANANVRILSNGNAYFNGEITAISGSIGGWTIAAGNLSSGNLFLDAGNTRIQCGNSASNYVRITPSGIVGVSGSLGTTFDLPSDGSAPTFSSGTIKECVYEIYTSGIIRTSANPASTGGVLINNTGIKGYSSTPELKFHLDATTGLLTATGVTISGAITATSGTIGGFTANPTEGLYAGSGGTRVQMKPGSGIWAGATAIGDAPFSVTNAGVLKATGVTISGEITSGSLIQGSYLYGSSLMTKGTFLSLSCNAAAGTLNVGSTADFPASGTAWIIDSSNDRDEFTYTGKTSTTLTGCSGVLAHTVSLSNKPLVVPYIEGMYISDVTNEMRFFGDSDCEGTIKELASIGMKPLGATDHVIAYFGSSNLCSDMIPVLIESDYDVQIYLGYGAAPAGVFFGYLNGIAAYSDIVPSEVTIEGTYGVAGGGGDVGVWGTGADGGWAGGLFDAYGADYSVEGNGNAYFSADVSALSFTDRTPFFEGDALNEIKKIKGSKGKIDHNSLPSFAKRSIKSRTYERIKGNSKLKHDSKLHCIDTKIVPGRDVGAMVSIITVGIQQLIDRVEKIEAIIGGTK